MIVQSLKIYFSEGNFMGFLMNLAVLQITVYGEFYVHVTVHRNKFLFNKTN